MSTDLQEIAISPAPDDSPEFANIVEALANGIITQSRPPALIVIKIDNWFGRRWLRFSGKTLGLAGVSNLTLTVPPFVPNRVISQRRFEPPEYAEVNSGKAIHLEVESSQAILRRFAPVADGAAVVWYSGRSAMSDRGSVMAYLAVNDDYVPWYTGWLKRKGWELVETAEISRFEITNLLAVRLLRQRVEK